MSEAPCIVDACDYPAEVTNLCGAHYNRQRRGVDLNAPMRRRRPPASSEPCAVAGATTATDTSR